MKYLSVGDMSQVYLMRRHNVQLKSTMAQLSAEMVSGISQDVGTAVGGDFTALAAIKHSLARSDAYAQIATETDLLAGTQQDALGAIQSHSDGIGVTMVSASTTSSATMVSSTALDAAQRFDGIIDALNVKTAGRYVFSGVSTDTKPLPDSESILTALATEITGLANATDIVAAVDAWFDDAARSDGYLNGAYQGSDTPLAPVKLSETDHTQITVTALDPTIRNMLKGFALATLVARDQVPDTAVTRATLLQTAGTKIMAANDELTVLRSEVGTVEATISNAQTRNSAEKSSLNLARLELIGVNDYETATALEAAQSQLETLYTLTSRLTQLSLTDYL